MSVPRKGVLAGVAISLGAMFSMSVAKYGILAQGLCFSLGLFIVKCCNAILFTGSVSSVGLVWDGEKTYDQVFNRWIWAWIFNFIGAVGAAIVAYQIGFDATSIAQAKATMTPMEIMIRAALCNVLVCFAVGVANASVSITDIFISCMLPVACFVVCGFEHSIADMFYMTLGVYNGAVSIHELFNVVLFSTAGNIVGGVLLTWLAYEHYEEEEDEEDGV